MLELPESLGSLNYEYSYEYVQYSYLDPATASRHVLLRPPREL